MKLNIVSDNEEESNGTLTVSDIIAVSAQLALKIKPTTNTNDNSKQNHQSFLQDTSPVGVALPVKSAIATWLNTAKQKCTSQMRPLIIKPEVLNRC